MKRLFDIFLSFFGLIVASPVLVVFILAVWLQDFKFPFYIAARVGKNQQIFSMVKLRSMVVNADKSGVDSTSANDMRITFVGRLIRKFKIDELSQLWNVLLGDMSFVGPRPNVQTEVGLYTDEELHFWTCSRELLIFHQLCFPMKGTYWLMQMIRIFDIIRLFGHGKAVLGFFIFIITASGLILNSFG